MSQPILMLLRVLVSWVGADIASASTTECTETRVGFSIRRPSRSPRTRQRMTPFRSGRPPEAMDRLPHSLRHFEATASASSSTRLSFMAYSVIQHPFTLDFPHM